MRARFATGWAIPRTPNAQHNWGLLGDFRLPLSMPENGAFRPGSKDVLGETLTTRQMTDLCIQHETPIIPTTLIHYSGDTLGWGYHGAAGRGRGPYLSRVAIRRYAREQFAWFKDQAGEEVISAVAFGNELAYSPRNEGDWLDYLDRVIDRAMTYRSEVLDAFGGNMEIILGCNHGKPESRGRKTLTQRLIERDRGQFFTVDIHGNGQSINEVVDEIQWCQSNGLRVAVMEDRREGPNNDAFNRTKAFSQAGAVRVGQFGSRNVNAEADNPNCRWGVGQQKRNRSTGAAWTCAGWLEAEYMRLSSAGAWCGNGRPGAPLPDDTDGPVIPPVDPPPTDPPGNDDPLSPLANLMRRTAAIAGAPKPKVSDLLEDANWREFAERAGLPGAS